MLDLTEEEYAAGANGTADADVVRRTLKKLPGRQLSRSSGRSCASEASAIPSDRSAGRVTNPTI